MLQLRFADMRGLPKRAGFWLVLALGVGTSCSPGYDDAKRHRSVQAEALATTLTALASRSDAHMDWEAQLLAGHGEFRLDQVLTAELQAAWVGERPILFTGTLDDIAALPDGEYEISISHDDFRFIGTEMKVRVLCNEAVGGAILRAYQADDSRLLFPTVAVVAKIESGLHTDQRTRR